jgi:hypothetical protein
MDSSFLPVRLLCRALFGAIAGFAFWLVPGLTVVPDFVVFALGYAAGGIVAKIFPLSDRGPAGAVEGRKGPQT